MRPSAVLLVRLGAVGDVVRTLPLLHALRSSLPDARIEWLVEEPSAGLLGADPALVVHVLPRRTLARDLVRPWRWPAAARRLAGLARTLRSRRFDLVLDAHGTLKAAVAARLAGAPVVGLAPPGSKEGARLLYARTHPFPATPMTRVRRALFLAAAEGLLGDDPCLGDEDDPRTTFGLSFDAARVAHVRALAAGGRRPFVVFFPFASSGRGQRKRWPLDRHVAVAARLAEDGCRTMIAWGSARERDEARGAVARAPAVELAPPSDLVELAELLREADLLVTGDTGPMHVAAAVGTPVLALFGPSDPVVNRPWGRGHRVLVGNPLSTLAEADVLAAARGLLAAPTGRQGRIA